MQLHAEGAARHHWKIVFALVLAELVSSFEASMIYAGLAQFYRIFGDPIAGRAFPEGAALVIEPGVMRLLGVVEFDPIQGGGFHGC
jgi:hypothetical protein